REAQLFNGSIVLVFCHECLRHAAMPRLPVWLHLVKLAKFGEGRLVITLVAIGTAQIVTDGPFVRRQAFRLLVLRDGCVVLVLLVQTLAKIALRFPIIRSQPSFMPILHRGVSLIAFFLERHSLVVMDFSIFGIAFESFLECVDSRGVLSIYGERQAELFVSLT